MKNVAFFIDNSRIADVDATSVVQGNPGIGGTEFLILLVSSQLAENSEKLHIALYGLKPQNVPSSVEFIVVDSLEEAIADAESRHMEFFVTKHTVENVTTPVLNSHSGMRFIVWCHVFVCYWELNAYAKNKCVDRIVFVGREMMDLYRDHVIMKKATYIYNCVPFGNCRDMVKAHPFQKRRNIVTYVGSIVPFKGFHLLAQAWQEILKEVPDAELYVIGSGKVYNDKAAMGSHGIAEEHYENLIFSYLTKDGKLLPGIHFMGRMGTEKDEILLQTKVGVPNPSGITETFCLSAVEMQMLGARVATIKAPGYLDTVKNGSLYNNPDQLARTVIKELNSYESKYDEAMAYFEQEFSIASVTEKWEKLLTDNLSQDDKLSNAGYRLKWLKECIRRISRIIPINRIFPSVERCLIAYERKIMKRTTFMDSNLTI